MNNVILTKVILYTAISILVGIGIYNMSSKISFDSDQNVSTSTLFCVDDNAIENTEKLSPIVTAEIEIESINEVNEIYAFDLDEYEVETNIESNIRQADKTISEIKKEIESPSDNIFHIELDAPINTKHQYVLAYELKGVEGSESTRLIINESPAIGGYQVVRNENWTDAKIILDARLLKKGKNSFRFDASSSTLEYTVRNVKITTNRFVNTTDTKLIFTPEIIRAKKQDRVYISGFTYDDDLSIIYNGDQTIPVHDGRFEAFVHFNEEELKFTYFKNGIYHEQKLQVSAELNEADYTYNIEKNNVSSDMPLLTKNNIEYHTLDVEIELPDDVNVKQKLVVSETRHVDRPPLGAEIINVTKDKKIYRFSPHGSKFEQHITLKLPYDKNLIPQGYTHKDINALYFDESLGRWSAVPIDTVDTEAGIVYAMTDHFTDYINGIIQVPESPSTSEFTPTMMQDVKAASPVANLNIMSPPKASQRGSAGTGLPIVVPPGKGGMQPQLAFSYSSEGGSSWVGYGWDISIPAISVDTRWGVPVFDPGFETEIYTLNGQQLIYDDESMPNRHEITLGDSYDTSLKPRTADAIFHERKLGSFAKIERKGSHPTSYYWKVTSSNGMINWYGNIPGGSATTLNNSEGVSYWPLVMSEDVFGNKVNYTYYKFQNKFYPNTISYNKNATSKVIFETPTIREDIRINGRFGFKQTDDKLLKKIRIEHNGSLVREYLCEHNEIRDSSFNCIDSIGRFHKTLLSSVTEAYPVWNGEAESFKHDFYYYDDTKNGLFAEAVIVDIPCATLVIPEGCETEADLYIDSDGDTVPDCMDNCPNYPNPLQNNDCVGEPCGIVDSDGDGIYNLCDLCPDVPDTVDENGDQYDQDNDGKPNACDNCPDMSNPSQYDNDEDGLGDICDLCPTIALTPTEGTQHADADGDGIGDVCDLCPDTPDMLDENGQQIDSDLDGVPDACDNCPILFNPNQHDLDLDTIGDLCDNCKYLWNPDQEDLNNNAIGDLCEIDETGCNNVVSENGYSKNAIITYLVPPNVEEVFVIFNPLQIPQTFKIIKNGNEILNTGPIRTGVNSQCENTPMIDLDLIDLGEQVGNLNGIRVNYEDFGGDPIAMIAGEFPLSVSFGEILEIHIDHPSCTGLASSWHLAIECESQLDLMNVGRVNETLVGIPNDEVVDTSHLSDYSIYTVSYGEGSDLLYAYEDKSGAIVERTVTNKKGGLTNKFLAKRKSVKVLSKNLKFSVNHINRLSKENNSKREVNKNKEIEEIKASNIQTKRKTEKVYKNKKNKNSSKSRIVDPEECHTLANIGMSYWLLPGMDKAWSPLGTSKTTASSYGISLGAGLSIGPPNAEKKANLVTGQLGFNGNVSTSSGAITYTDINGDGYSDMIERRGKDRFIYRPHFVSTDIVDNEEVVQHSFGAPIDMVNIKEIQRSSSSGTSLSITASLAVGPIGFNVGDISSKSEVTNDIYMTDVNGDGLTDVTIDDKVLFNHIDEVGRPTFTLSSEPTENMIVTGDQVDISQIIPDIPTSYAVEHPDFDAVKVWKAPAEGNIVIENLIDQLPAGAKVSIETDVNGIYGRDIASISDTGTCRLFHGTLGMLQTISGLPSEMAALDCKMLTNSNDPCTIDSDGDGVSDCIDICPTDPTNQCLDCPETLKIDEDVIDESFDAQAASDWIKAKNKIDFSSEAEYRAGNEVSLEGSIDKSFEVEEGGEFLAYIGSCVSLTDSIILDEEVDDDPLSSLRVRKGQNIYFRIHAEEPYKEVAWDPQVKYTNVLGKNIDPDKIQDPNGLTPYKNTYSKDFNLSSSAQTIVPCKSDEGTATITWPAFELGGLSDDISIEINRLVVTNIVEKVGDQDIPVLVPEESKQNIFPLTVLAGETSLVEAPTDGIDVDVEYHNIPFYPYGDEENDASEEGEAAGEKYTALEFIAHSNSNVDWSSINWHPKVEFSCPEDGVINLPEGGEPQAGDTLVNFDNNGIVYPIVRKEFYATYNNRFDPNQELDVSKHTIVTVPDQLFNKELYFSLNHDLFDDASDHETDCNDNMPDGADDNEQENGYCVGEISLVIKQNGKTLGRQMYFMDDGGIEDGDDDPSITTPVRVFVQNEEDRDITVEIYVSDGYVAQEAMKYIMTTQLDDDEGLVELRFESKYKGGGVEAVLKKNLCNIYHKTTDPFGHFYRNWGQFMYNVDEGRSMDDSAESDDFGYLLNTKHAPKMDGYSVNQDDFEQTLEDIKDYFENPDGEDGELPFNVDSIASQYLPETSLFISGLPYKQVIDGGEGELSFIEKWRGLTPRNFSGKFSGRAIDMGVSEYETIQEHEEVVVTEYDDFTGTYAIPRIMLSKSGTTPKPTILPNTSKHITTSSTVNLTDYIDINGDRYPDIVTPFVSLMTKSTGGLYTNEDIIPAGDIETIGNLGLSQSNSTGYSASGETGWSLIPSSKAGGTFKENKAIQFLRHSNETSVGLSVTGSATVGKNFTDLVYTDINGDGLSDRINKNNNTIDIGLNVGNGYIQTEPISIDKKMPIEGSSLSVSAGLGFALSHAETYQFGVSLGRGYNNSQRSLLDINADGLPDLVTSPELGIVNFFSGDGDLHIDFNNGHDFVEDIATVSDVSSFNNLGNSVSTNYGNNLGVTFGITVLIPVPFVPLWLKVAQFGLHGSIKTLSVNKAKKIIQDFDGDGYPDLVEQHGQNAVKVKYSQVKRTNKLKKIVTPIGGEYTVDYDVVRPSYECQSAKWVMGKVKVEDPNHDTVGDIGEGEATKYYKYHRPKYDRREREFLGFEVLQSIDATVTDDVVQDDLASFKNYIFREKIDVFHNDSYYTAGKLKESYVLEGHVDIPVSGPLEGNLTVPTGQLYSKTTNEYKLRDINTDWTMSSSELPLDYDVGGTKGLGRAYCVLESATSEMYETTSNPMSLTQSFVYDNYGRVTNYDHGGEYQTNIGYESTAVLLDKNLINTPNSISVYASENSQSVLKRKRTIDSYNDFGQPESVTSLTGSGAATNILQYNPDGTLYRTISPYIGSPVGSVTTIYNYDSQLDMYPTTVTSDLSNPAETYVSTSEYDTRFGTVTNTTDIHGESMSYTLDNMGRVRDILDPLAALDGAPYTIKFEYHPLDGARPYAVTKHYDHFGTDDIETITIANALGQSVQVKKDISYYDVATGMSTPMMSVSGLVRKDHLGRAIQQYHPSMEDKGIGNIEFTALGGLQPPSSTTDYDVLDRPVLATDPAMHTTEMTYTIDGGLAKTTSKVQQTENGLGGYIHSISIGYKDVFGRDVRSVSVGPDGDIETNFEYDGIGQLTTIIPDDGFETTYEYDLGGRVTKRIHPDAGEELYTYDVVGNILTKTSSLGTVTNTYDGMSRPVSITYPAYANNVANVNDVTFDYYENTNTHRGRLKKLSDATGSQEYVYDELGNITELSRTVQTPNTLYKFVTKSDYDSWGRLVSLEYPDQEVLTYGYDTGGNLTDITGDIPYISTIGYDEYEQKVYCSYGNGTETTYTYDAQLRRLDHLKTLASPLTGGQAILDNDYDYDFVGNITSLTNMAAANNGIGGAYSHTYQYDNLNRLTYAGGCQSPGDCDQATSSAYYRTNMEYDNMHKIQQKHQVVSRNGVTDPALTMTGDFSNYQYFDGAGQQPPRALKMLGNSLAAREFSYDGNGNMISDMDNTQGQGASKYMCWDQRNLMKGVKVDGHLIQHYMYDAGGERVLKANGTMTTTAIGGFSNSLAALDNYTVYPSGHITVSSTGRYTKHYYSGSERIVSRLSGVHPFGGGVLDADLQSSQVNGELNLMKIKFEASNLSVSAPPPVEEDCTQYPPGSEARKQCLCEHDPTNCPDDVLYYFHQDHLGSSSYLTDADGKAYQFLLYLPWGESLVEQKVADFSTPYQFNGKELDKVTGLYNYGARYYDPKLALWTGVDPLAVKMPSWSPYNYTFNNPVRFIDPDGRMPEDWPPKWWNDYKVGTRLIGALKTVGGVGEMAVGVAGVVAPEPLTSGLGALAVTHGADVTQSGLSQMWSGENTQSMTSEIIEGMGASEQTAEMIDGSISIVTTLGTAGALNSGDDAARALASGSSKTINIVDDLITNPTSIWGKSADEIAASFNKAGYTAKIEASTKGSKLSQQVRISGHPNISNIQVHPGGGRHVGSYYKVSTSTQGKFKVVNPATYVPSVGEKTPIFNIK